VTLLHIGLALLALAAGGSAAASAETISVDGITRTFTLVAPERRPVPLVVVLHGALQQGGDMARSTEWSRIARQEQFAVLYPDGRNRAWGDLRSSSERGRGGPPAGTDDVAFLTALIAQTIASGVGQADHVYVTGVSNGGAMAFTMVCQRADLFAAAAAAIIALTDGIASACHPHRPVPMLVMNGTADPLVAYTGGRGTSRFALPKVWSTSATVDFWRRHNGCELRDGTVTGLEDLDPADGSTVTLVASVCPPDAEVLLYRIDGGGHRLPSLHHDARFPVLSDRLLGSQNHDIDAAAEMWKFFRRY
jgi:polyhydroxybutyrate depolymerase